MGRPQKHFPFSRVIPCPGCGRVFRPLGAKSVYCSVPCNIACNTTLNHETGCLEWGGYRNLGGYGQIRIKGQVNSIRVHRYVYELHHGPVASDQVIRHRCDNPPCCNIDHLEVGSRAENVADAVARGRHPRGENNGHSKLVDDDIRAIKLARKAGMRVTDIAAMYGISIASASLIIHGRIWRHVK